MAFQGGAVSKGGVISSVLQGKRTEGVPIPCGVCHSTSSIHVFTRVFFAHIVHGGGGVLDRRDISDLMDGCSRMAKL